MSNTARLAGPGSTVADDARRRALGLVCAGFEGTSLDRRTAELLGEGLAGVVLFARNVADREQVAALCGEILDAADGDVLIAVDHEGGRVQRLRGEGFTDLPSARAIGEMAQRAEGDAAAVRAAADAAATAAHELRAVGINLNFAPVLDVDTNPDNPVIGDRSFGRDPELVSRLGVAFMRSLQRHGVAACGKHFPGHGDTRSDSHLELPRIAHDRIRLDAVELAPFRDAIGAGIASIMTAHVVVDALDPAVPATLSRVVIEELLRGELGFDGVIVSDDLDMRAISDHFDVGEAAVRAVEAGVDLILCCRDPEYRDRAIDALTAAIVEGRLSAERVDASLDRIAQLARAYG